ncbi:MAG: ABC transporter permease [Bacteroidota bacterium]
MNSTRQGGRLNMIGRQPLSAGLCLVALALVVASAYVGASYVYQEWSYDRHHENVDRVFRITQRLQLGTIGTVEYATLPGPVAENLVADIDGVLPARLYHPQPAPVVASTAAVNYEPRLFMADPSLLSVFTIPLSAGDPVGALREPRTIIISEEAAERYFPGADPMGRTLRYENAIDLTVTGVLAPAAMRSHVDFDMLISMGTRAEVLALAGIQEDWITSWIWNPYATYVRLADDVSIDALVNTELPAFIQRYMSFDDSQTGFLMQPVTDIHLYSSLEGELQPNGSALSVGLAALGMGLVVLFGAIAFVTAARVRRKPVDTEAGPTAPSLVSFGLIGLVAGGVAAGVAPWLGSLLAPGSVPPTPTVSGSLMMVAAAVVLALGLGWWATRSLQERHNEEAQTRKGPYAAAGLQLVVALTALVAMLFIHQQLSFVDGHSLGFDLDHAYVLPIAGNADLMSDRDALKAAIDDVEGVVATSLVSAVPTQSNYTMRRFRAEDRFYSAEAAVFYTDEDFMEALDLQLIAGGDVTGELPYQEYLVNSELVAQLGWDPEYAIGKQFAVGESFGVVSGVLENFHFEPLDKRVVSMTALVEPEEAGYLIVRVDPEAPLDQVQAGLTAVWNERSADRPFLMESLAQEARAPFVSERFNVRLLTGITALLLLMVGISLGVSSGYAGNGLTGSQRRRRFLLLGLVSLAVAMPVGYAMAHAWATNAFAYVAFSNGWLYLASGVLLSGIAVWFAMRNRSSAPAPITATPTAA